MSPTIRASRRRVKPPDNRTLDGALACAFGWPWLDHDDRWPLLDCPYCRAYAGEGRA